MYWLHCSACGWEENGTFSPAPDAELGVVDPVEAFIEFSGVQASAEDLFILSRLHPSLKNLRPQELRAIALSGRSHPLGKLYPYELERVRGRASGTRYKVVVHGAQASPRQA